MMRPVGPLGSLGPREGTGVVFGGRGDGGGKHPAQDAHHQAQLEVQTQVALHLGV